MSMHVAIYRLGHSQLSDAERQAAVDAGMGATTIIYADQGKQRRRWKLLMTHLDDISCIVVRHVADLPGRTIRDLLAILKALRENGTTMRTLSERIDTEAGGAAAVIDLIAAYRAAKLAEAIRAGQEKAREKGKSIGRPSIPKRLRRAVQAALENGDGVRHTARRYGLSPASVVNIKKLETDGRAAVAS